MRNLTRKLRIRAAIVIAVAYAFCVLAPSAALALVGSPTAFHCLSDLNGMSTPAKQVSTAHTHGDGASHYHEQSGVPDHHSGKGDKAHTSNCCGLFCVTAMAHDPGVTFGIFAPAPPAVSLAVSGLIGRAPSPLHRPPIA